MYPEIIMVIAGILLAMAAIVGYLLGIAAVIFVVILPFVLLWLIFSAFRVMVIKIAKTLIEALAKYL